MKINIPCKKCNVEKSFTLEAAKEFNKEKRYVCEACIKNNKCDCGKNLGISCPYENTSSNTETIIRQIVQQKVEHAITLSHPWTHGHQKRSDCPLCGHQQHHQPWTLDSFELGVLAIIVMIFITGVVGIIMWNPLGPHQDDNITQTI